MRLKQKQQSGFTLIELLVVMSIISLMSSMTFAAIQKSRSVARDSRREADAKQILNALAIEYANKGKVPCYGDWFDSSFTEFSHHDNPDYMQGLVDDKVISTNPKDPLNDINHHYSYITFKAAKGGPCGQIAYIDYTTENPISSCVGGGVLFVENGIPSHCHIFFPNPPNCPDWSDAKLTGCTNYIDKVHDYYSNPN